MAWWIELSDTAAKQLGKLEKDEARCITDFLRQCLVELDNPRSQGKALTGPLGGLRRYRIGDHRIICERQDNVLCVLVIKMGNRRDVYR